MIAFLRLGLRASGISLSPWTPLVLPRLHNNNLYILANDNKDQSLAKRLENLAIQSEFILGLPGSEPVLKRMCQQISSVYMSIMKKEESIQATKLPKEQWSNFYKAKSVTFNDMILADFHCKWRQRKLKGGCSTTTRLLTATNVFSTNTRICGHPSTTARL
jgi:hypothetical protein